MSVVCFFCVVLGGGVCVVFLCCDVGVYVLLFNGVWVCADVFVCVICDACGLKYSMLYICSRTYIKCP